MDLRLDYNPQARELRRGRSSDIRRKLNVQGREGISPRIQNLLRHAPMPGRDRNTVENESIRKYLRAFY